MADIQSTPPSPAFEVGDQVRHPKFGIGTVLYKSGEGEGLKLDIVFAEEGQKKLLVRYANLKKVDFASAETATDDAPEGDAAADPPA